MTRWSLATVVVALVNSLLYAAIYREYLGPVYPNWFEVLPRGPGELAITVTASIVPLWLRSRHLSAASALAILTYALYFVPSLWQFHYGLDAERSIVVGLQSILACCMALLFLASREWTRVTIRVPRLPVHVLLGLIAAMIFSIGWTYRSSLQFVSFADVYDVRLAAADLGASPFIGYLTMWCTYCFMPYCFARGLLCKDVLALGVGLAGSAVIYMATGAKSAILTPIILGGLFVVMRTGRQTVEKLLLAMVATGAALLWILPEGAVFDWARSVYFMRTMGSSGWTMQVYYEFFATHGHTYWSHVAAVDLFTDDYALYRPYALGQLIGIEVSGSEVANFNAGFWASDGLAAFGALGLPIATILVATYFVVLNIAARDLDRRFGALWASGFAAALLNLPLSTAMVSGGGVLMLFLLISAAGPARDKF